MVSQERFGFSLAEGLCVWLQAPATARGRLDPAGHRRLRKVGIEHLAMHGVGGAQQPGVGAVRFGADRWWRVAQEPVLPMQVRNSRRLPAIGQPSSGEPFDRTSG